MVRSGLEPTTYYTRVRRLSQLSHAASYNTHTQTLSPVPLRSEPGEIFTSTATNAATSSRLIADHVFRNSKLVKRDVDTPPSTTGASSSSEGRHLCDLFTAYSVFSSFGGRVFDAGGAVTLTLGLICSIICSMVSLTAGRAVGSATTLISSSIMRIVSRAVCICCKWGYWY